MKLIVAFGRFWYDFLVGDDWKIACSVVLTLGVLVVFVRADVLGDRGLTVLGGALLMAAFTTSLLIDVRRSGTRK